MKHLVTGGSGFLGNLIALRLHARGEQVRILDVWDDPARPPGIEFVHCDIRNRAGVARAMQGMEIIHHNVALVPLSKAGHDFWTVNVDGSRIAAEEAARAKAKAYIYQSSSAIFGVPHKCPIMADTPPEPAEAYGRAKWAGELATREICEKANLPLTVIRPRTILGAGRLGIFQILFQWIEENRRIYVIGQGNTLFQFVHAHDLMDAYMLALDAGKPGIYNVGTDRFGTLREGLEKLITYAGSTSKVTGLPAALSINALRVLDWMRLSPLGPYHYLTYGKAYYFDVQPLLKLGWKPKYSNDEMFRETFDWFRQHRHEIAKDASGSPHRSEVKQRLLGLLKKIS